MHLKGKSKALVSLPCVGINPHTLDETVQIEESTLSDLSVAESRKQEQYADRNRCEKLRDILCPQVAFRL